MMRIVHRVFLAMLEVVVKGLKMIWFILNGNNKRTFYGEAAFMDFFQRERKLISRYFDGLFVESNTRIPLETSFQHIQLVASTGQGKTTRYILNHLLRIRPNDNVIPSLIILDPTKEIYYQSAGYLTDIYQIRRIDFSSPKFSDSWNPIGEITSQMELDLVADVLIRSAFPSSQKDSFWNDSSKSLLSVMIACLQSSQVKPQYRNLHNVRFLLNSFGKDGKPINEFFASTSDARLIKEIEGLLSNSEKVLLSIVTTAKTALRLWANEDICRITTHNSFRFEELRNQPTCLYISMLESEIQALQPIISLLLTQLFSFLMKTPEESNNLENQYLPVFAFLEEIGNCYIPNLSLYVSTLRKRKVSLSFISQSLNAQFERQYGVHEAETITSNINTKIIFPGMDLKSSEQLERLLGNQSLLKQRNIRRSFFGYTNPTSLEEQVKPLMTAQQLRIMEHPILISGNQLPTKLKHMKPFYSDRILVKRSKLNAPVSKENKNEIEFIDLNEFSVKSNSSNFIDQERNVNVY